MKPEVDAGVGGEGLVVEAGEIWLGAPAGKVGFEVGELGEGEAEVAPDGGVVSLDFGESFEVEGSLVERGQFGLGEGPAAFGDTGARGEVEGVELEDLASPADGGSAFDADAAGVDAAMRKAGDFAVVEGLRGVFADRAASFEEQHFFSFAGELYGERDAGGSRTYDADVCGEVCGRDVVEEVVNHFGLEEPLSCRTGRLRGARSLRDVCTLSCGDDRLWSSRWSEDGAYSTHFQKMACS